jgi:hypothetical protein
MKKIGIIGIVLVLCLALVGVGYSHWTKTLIIDGSVTTGTFGVEWSVMGSSDNEIDKDVGMQGITVVDNVVYLSISDAYPCYEATFELDIHGTGTVPAHINAVNMLACDPYLDVQIIGPSMIQLHECDMAYVTVIIHVLQEDAQGVLLPMGATLGVALEIVCDQFNYVP